MTDKVINLDTDKEIEYYEQDLDDAIRHGMCVSRLSSELARELGLPEEEIHKIAVAGMIHDIGKLRITPYIYGRGNSMKIEEMRYVRLHAKLGADIARQEGYGDDIADIMAKVKDAEVIVYATPIYYYEMCGQMKTLLDRLNPLYSTDYSFRDIYMIATAAENDESAFEKAYNGLQGWVDCFEKASLKGMVGGGGIDAANTAADHVDAMKKAYELGKKL